MNSISKVLSVIAFLFSSINLVVGQANTGELKGRNQFLLGNELLSLGMYEIADSFYSLALSDYEGSDIYFNRGIARLFMEDTLGFCNDMYIAGNFFFFPKADTLFNRVCCHKVDSIFRDKDMNITDSANSRYLEELMYFKYENVKKGRVHDKDRSSVTQTYIDGSNPLFQLKFSSPTNVMARYEYIDSIKYYYTEAQPKKISDRRELAITNERYKQILNDTIDLVLGSRGNSAYSLFITVYFDNTGKASFYKDAVLYSSGNLIGQTSFIDQILNEYIETLPVFKTPKPFGKEEFSKRFINFTF